MSARDELENADQPPEVDIHDQGKQNPPAGAAAERVWDFVAWFGDGEVIGERYDGDNPPLYARDLDALVKEVRRKPRTITTAEELDALEDAVLVLTEQGGYWESVKRMDGKNWWKEPGNPNVVHSHDLTLPATVLYEPAP